uniref:Uncharacterized protein n=1 Tax=Anguilla anguilla TaxID=7936 RepID=A0A0E9RDH8_ANGAN
MAISKPRGHCELQKKLIQEQERSLFKRYFFLLLKYSGSGRFVKDRSVINSLCSVYKPIVVRRADIKLALSCEWLDSLFNQGAAVFLVALLLSGVMCV